ncbi:MAG: transglycosylase SLT domain-containing protein [Acidobacteriia bacterium]|nr:transglycosylase SLT domain-containing protein [Terriglobia bacterium]
MRFAGRLAFSAGVLLLVSSVCFAHPNSAAEPVRKAAVTPKQLEKLSRALRQSNPSPAYAQLSNIATQKSSGALGVRAALALGYFDYGKGNYAQAAKWLARAKGDPLLADYAAYWSAETDLALGRSADALAGLKRFRVDFPDSVMTDQALQSLGDAALAGHQPAEAVAALDAYASTPQRPALLFLRAEAREQAGKPLDAVADYQAVYTRFPTSEQARQAATKLGFLRSTLGAEYPALPLDQRVAHAASLFAAKNWRDARNEYAELLPELSGADRERAQLRILECSAGLGAGPSEMTALIPNDPDVDAERFASLADYYRAQQQDTQMVAAVESAVARAPSSHWAEAALFLAGNYFWVQLDRDRAASYYKRFEESFSASPNAVSAQWRVAWTAVLKRQPESAEMLQAHLRRFPGSQYTPDALYWLGRLSEEAGTPALARGYYAKLIERYPQNYFQGLASERLRDLGVGTAEKSDVLAFVPPVSAAPKLDGPIPPAAAGRQSRADALRSIAFDSSAELELRAGYAATGEPRLLLQAAQSAVDAGHYGAAVVTVRQVFPQLESQPVSVVPRDVWRVAYALPFESSIRKWSARQGLDPMIVAGLIHQESAFEPEARSGKNAIGLMQLIGPTARRLAKQENLRYSQARLVDPDYNVRLGTAYFASLRKQFGGVESALAAYNAGEDRVAFWTAGQTYRDKAEFVDSIPFTETRQYVEIVTRNADIYRRLYGAQSEFSPARTRHGH